MKNYTNIFIDKKENDIRDWFDNDSGNAKGCLVSISGGKDCAVVAALLCNAIGKDKVFGLLQPNGNQVDIQDSIDTCNHLGIDYKIVNIKESYKSIVSSGDFSEDALINVAPRIRMTNGYLFAQSMNYRVIGTGNASEIYIGYFTKHGDGASDYNPIKDLLCSDVVAIANELGLPNHIANKQPSDGLCGKSDEERFGFTYAELDGYISGDVVSNIVSGKIELMHIRTAHKR